MRVIVFLMALVAAPFITSVAQGQQGKGRGHDAEHCAMRAALHPGMAINKCPSGGPGEETPPPAGSSFIEGSVRDLNAVWPNPDGLANWTLQLTGPVTASATTDLNGNYAFTGLPDGDYTVCAVVQAGWTQVSPDGCNYLPLAGALLFVDFYVARQ